jgi:quercetin dioxygenase-like cupin family protein
MRAFVAVALLAFVSTARAEDDAAVGRRVQDLLRAHQNDVYGCVSAAGGAVRGEVLVRVVVGEGGAVARAEALKSDGDGGKVAACFVDKVRGWSVASLGAAAGDQVVFPLAFRPDDSAAAATTTPPQATVEPIELQAKAQKKTIAHSGQMALFVVRGKVRLGKDVLGPHDLVWLAAKQPAKVVADEPSLLVKVETQLLIAAPAKPLPPRFVVRASEPRAWPVAAGKAMVRLYLPAECNLAVDWVEAQAGVKIPPHRHEGSDEILYIVDGSGTTTIAEAAHPTKPGTVIRVPAGVQHALTVDEPLAAVQVYAPGGPEQRFTKGPVVDPAAKRGK